MRAIRLVLCSLTHHRAANLGIFAGVAIAAMILGGALMVGDSVRGSLKQAASNRLGQASLVIDASNRFFREALAEDLSRTSSLKTAPLLQLKGSLSNPENSLRANQAQMLGVSPAFWNFSPSPMATDQVPKGVAISRLLAAKLGLKEGDEAVARIEKPSLLPRDAPLSTIEDLSVAVRFKVDRIVGEESYGSFSLQANQIPPLNVFLPLSLLQKRLELPGKANRILVADSTSTIQTDMAAAIRKSWNLDDAALEVRALDGKGVREARTSRIFMEQATVDAALLDGSSPDKVFTYLVNELRAGDKATPYSMVAGRQRLALPDGQPLKEDEIIIHEWLAEDLGVAIGDRISVAFYVLGPMRRLIEERKEFTVRLVAPLSGEWLDSDLMPDFPGLSGAEDCREWEPGFAIDTTRIRDKDEEYWDKYRGAPKAFVTLKAAQEMWSNRFGELTAIRYPAQGNAVEDLASRILARLDPSSIGISILPIRELGEKAAAQAIDFGQLFIGFSFFLILSALILISLLNAFNIERRSEEIGILRSMGHSVWRIAGLHIAESLLTTIPGAVLGALLACFYTRLILLGLSTIWAGAIGEQTAVRPSIEFPSIAATVLIGILMSILAIALTLRSQVRKPIRELLSRIDPGMEEAAEKGHARPPRSRLLANLASVALLISLFVSFGKVSAPAFFLNGFLLLLVFLLSIHAQIASGSLLMLKGKPFSMQSLSSLNVSRRKGRSMAVISLLAIGSFLVISVGANRKDVMPDLDSPSSGTGGFELIGESALPLLQDLNTEEGCNAYGLSRADIDGVVIVPLRLHEGDDASCLNLNRAQNPTLLGVDPSLLALRKSFSFSDALDKADGFDSPWRLLESQESLSAIADQATLQWGLQKQLGDTLSFVDENGQPFEAHIAAALNGSILQGKLILSESAFQKRYPSESGYRMILIDAPPGQAEKVRETLSRALEPLGMDIASSSERLQAYHAVENTYLSIFQALGGLGLILGSIGLGIVLLRNVLERRSELAILQAVGFSRAQIQQIIFKEHVILLGAGLMAGILSGLVAALPSLMTSAQFPAASLSASLAALLLSGWLWIKIASRSAMSGALLDALRQE